MKHALISPPAEPTDIDQIYQVLKKAGEISSGKVSAVESRVQVNSTSTSDANAVMTGASNSQLEIPVVNVPAYPDRTPKKGPVKPQWPNFQPQKGLSAPSTMDMSNSGPHH